MTSSSDLPDSSEHLAWYAVHVRPQHEHKVSLILNEKGIESFLPTYKRRSRWADRIKIIDQPLFAGYVFCHTTPLIRTPILTTPGVIDIVGNRRAPLPIDDGEMNSLRTLVASGLQCEPVRGLIAGESVRITGGPLAGTSGVITDVRNEIRLVVSISLLQRSVLAEIDSDWVELVNPKKGSRPVRACIQSHGTI